IALHKFNNRNTPPVSEWIKLPEHIALQENRSIATRIKTVDRKNFEFFTITTEDNVTMDGWIVKPENFDSSKKYPILLYVYGEPGRATVEDEFNAGKCAHFLGDLSKSGYFY